MAEKPTPPLIPIRRLEPGPVPELGPDGGETCDCEEPGILWHPDLGAVPGEAEPVQLVERCDMCQRYEDDEAAARALAARLGFEAVFLEDRDWDLGEKDRGKGYGSYGVINHAAPGFVPPTPPPIPIRRLEPGPVPKPGPKDPRPVMGCDCLHPDSVAGVAWWPEVDAVPGEAEPVQIVQACGGCRRYKNDEDAARALAARLGVEAVFLEDRAWDIDENERGNGYGSFGVINHAAPGFVPPAADPGPPAGPETEPWLTDQVEEVLDEIEVLSAAVLRDGDFIDFAEIRECTLRLRQAAGLDPNTEEPSE